MHNYIINDRVLFDTLTGGLSRLDDPSQQGVLNNNAKRLLLRLIDSGYQIVPFEQLASEIKDHKKSHITKLVAAEAKQISEAFRGINEFEQIVVSYSHGIQLSTDVELKVVTSYRTYDDTSEESPHIAKEQLFNPAHREHREQRPAQKHQHKENHFVWYYTRIALIVTLFIFLLYFALNFFSSSPSYFADYHFQGKYNACNVYIHNQKPTDMSLIKMRIEKFGIPCDTPKNVYFSLPADDKRESIQVCNDDPGNESDVCTNFYVVKVK